jgi:hypothetical protein
MALLSVMPAICCNPALAESALPSVRVRIDSAESLASGYKLGQAAGTNIAFDWYNMEQGSQTRGRGPGADVHKRPRGVKPERIIVTITVDLGKAREVGAFSYPVRSAGSNGVDLAYEFYVSSQDMRFTEPLVKGAFDWTQAKQTVGLGGKRKSRYLKLRVLSEVSGKPWTSVAELQIHSDGKILEATVPKSRQGEALSGSVSLSPGAGPDGGTVAGALGFAQRTLVFVEQSAVRPALAAELAALQKKIKDACPDAPVESLLTLVRKLRRRIILSHPALAFERLLINKRPPPGFSYLADQYLGRHSGMGDGLVVLDAWKDNPLPSVLLKDTLPPGSTLHPDLSFDGKRIAFSYCDHTQQNRSLRRFFIYEVNVDGRGLRQVTGTARDSLQGAGGRATTLIEDWDPCYLPDGGFAFISSRNQGAMRSHFGGRYCPTYTLYRMEGDGSKIRPMVYGEANEWDPSVLPDGRIIWTRWDYINRHDTLFQGLWTIRPDGSGTAHFYGNYTRNPCGTAEARVIPGSRKVVATAFANHSYTAGSIVAIDPSKGQDGLLPVQRITPETPFPETEAWGENAYATPWPINEDLFLVAYADEALAQKNQHNSPNAYAIYLIDSLGGRELIYRDPQQSCFAPIPIRSRVTPPALASQMPKEAEGETGVFFVKDVYQSSAKIPQGSVKRLRVVEVLPQTTQAAPPRSAVVFETAKRILGTVPVEEDGSVAFRAPAGRPLFFQLLDQNGMSVMNMRSFVYLHAGESQSCVGCHEPREETLANSSVGSQAVVRELEAPVGPSYDGGLSFVRSVQPVLDRYCIHCHGLGKAQGNLNLLGIMPRGSGDTKNLVASAAYNSLVELPGLVSLAQRNNETPYSVARDYFSHAGRLAKMLLTGDEHHPPVGDPDGLDQESFQRIVDWLDLNGQFYGDYSWNKAEWRTVRPNGERALREHIRSRFGPELAAQPFAALVNLGMPEQSRILNAPLCVRAGGWGQIAENGWAGRDDPGYRKMLTLVRASIVALSTSDTHANCNRTPCECRSCWVRQARKQQLLPRLASGEAH